MIKEEKEQVLDIIDNEGFGYAFMHYSDFDFVKDEEFHRLRKNFIHAGDELDTYIGDYDDDEI